MSPDRAAPEPQLPFAPAAGGGLRLAVRLSPRASRNRIEGSIPLADGGTALKVAVTAPPEAGRANAALIALLAKELHLPKGRIRLVAGASARLKTLLIAGEAGDLGARLKARLDRAGG